MIILSLSVKLNKKRGKYEQTGKGKISLPAACGATENRLASLV
jgi:hypothetical protein